MSYIYGIVCHPEEVDSEALGILKADLQRYPTDGHIGFTDHTISGGLFYQNLRKPPFPSEKPVKDSQSGIVIFASARLDYRDLLLQKLELEKSQLNQLTDTQLILKAYLRWGEKCVDRLEGDFSFLIWNPSKEYLWGARDPLGFQPLFFTIKAKTCYFSSHTTGLAKLPGVSRNPDELFLANRLLRTEVSPLATPYEGISQIPVGHTMRIDQGRVTILKYYHWQVTPMQQKVSREDYASELSVLLSDAINTRLYSDYPVGGFLSAGLDSSSVMSILQEQLRQQDPGKKLITASSVHLNKEDSRYEDERPWVELFSKHFPGVQINYCSLKDTPAMRPQDAEFFSTVRFRRYPTMFMTEMMQDKLLEAGCRTFFTGWRGDHFISRRGYAHYADFFKRGKFLTLYRAIQDTAAFTGRSPKALFKSIIKDNLPVKGIDSENFPGLKYLSREWVEEMWAKNKRYRPQWKLNDMNADFSWLLPDRQGTHQYYEDTSYHHKAILKRMIPLSDPRIINFALQLPAEEFSKGGMDRSIMRRAVKDYLPDELRLRNTKGSFMGNESAISAKIHAQWLEHKNIKQIIIESSLSTIINPNYLQKHIAQHKKNITTGNVGLHQENSYLLNLLGFLFFFGSSRLH